MTTWGTNGQYSYLALGILSPKPESHLLSLPLAQQASRYLPTVFLPPAQQIALEGQALDYGHATHSAVSMELIESESLVVLTVRVWEQESGYMRQVARVGEFEL